MLGVLASTLHAQAPSTQNPAPSTLPRIPRTQGSLNVRIVYPVSGSLLTARDSNFIFGQAGSGDASLTINGFDVPVAPNGAFLAFLPVPPGDSLGVYHVTARQGGDSTYLQHPVRLPRRFVPPAALWIDAGSIAPRGNRWAEPGELIRVSVSAAPGATVTLQLPSGNAIPLVPNPAPLTPVAGPFDLQPRAAELDIARYSGVFAATHIGTPLPSVTQALVPLAPGGGLPELDAWVVAARGADTVRVPFPLRLSILDPARRAVVILDDDTARAGNTDGAAVGKPLEGGTFEWFFRNGTLASVSGRAGAEVRLALSRTASVWVGIGDVAATLPDGTPPPSARVALVRLAPRDSFILARVSLSARVPIKVDEAERSLTLRLYGARADLDWLQYGSTDPFVRRMTWAQPSEDEVTVTFELDGPVWGYRSRWQGNDFVFEIRRRPRLNRAQPLRGRVIAIDPGHPPAGSTGPTGFREAEANLGVSLALQRLLTRAGARVIMTRTADTAIGLYERTNQAEREGAELLVSIHNNAFPDGVNPFENNGTSAYYFHPRAARLAFLVQEGMLRTMGLRNIGFGRGDLALARPTWMPSVLTEGAFMMLPDQENALKTPSFQERYARGVMQGIERYLRETLGR